MKGREIPKFVYEYIRDNDLPLFPSSQVVSGKWSEEDTEYGVIPFDLHKVGPAFWDDKILLSLSDGVEEYFLGARTYYVRESDKAISFINEDSEKGIIIYRVDKFQPIG